jgi:DNA polymerase III epsilon subunit-like protein
MARRLVVLASNKELASQRSYEACVLAQIMTLGTGDVLLVGDAPDARVLTIKIAIERGVRLIEFQGNGERRENGTLVKGWASDLSASSIYRAMYTAACKAHSAGWSIQTFMFDGSSADLVYPHTDGYPVELTANDLPLPKPPLTESIVVSETATSVPPATVVSPWPPTGTPHVWIDLETGGRGYNLSPIIEIGAVITDSTHRPVIGTYESRIAVPPDKWVDDEARKVNGYSEFEWRDAREEDEVMHEFTTWLPREFVLCGYSVQFDRGFLRAACGRHGLREPGWKPTPIDPMYIVRSKIQKVGAVKNAKLDEACRHLGIPSHVSHRALADAERARLVHLALLGKKPETSIFDKGWKPLVQHDRSIRG